MARRSVSDTVALVVAAAFLCGAAAHRLTLPRPSESAPYHARVREAAQKVPAKFGGWVGTDVPVPTLAVEALRPNVMISRAYEDVGRRRRVSLLVVQCPDVRDLTPHYPPMCYPGRGLRLVRQRAVDWRVGDLTVTGTRYEFDSITFQRSNLTVVDNFILLPDGRIAREMKGVEREIGLANRYYGAAQVQIVYDAGTPEAERSEVTRELLTALRPLMDVIRTGVVR